MRELSLHILDLMENSIRAGARRIEVRVEERPAEDRLLISVEDDGRGLSVREDVATDPFYTTKEGKKTGLGLSLFRFRVEQAGGTLALERAALGGLSVRAEMALSHVDRSPLGDLASTIASIAATNPEVELHLSLHGELGAREVSTAELARELPAEARGGIAIARAVRQRITEGLSALHLTE